METITVRAVIDSEYFNNPPHLKIHCNDQVLADLLVTEETVIEKELSIEEDTIYKLNFTLYDKSECDTVIKEDGEIVKDTVVKVKNVKLDDIDVTSMLPLNQDKFYYIHDVSQEKKIFYDTMGVNGTSTIEFTSPFYVWLLETL